MITIREYKPINTGLATAVLRYQAKRRRRRIFRTAMCTLSGFSFLLLIGIVGGMDQDTIGIGEGFIESALALAGFIGGAYLGGMMEECEN